MIIQVNTNYKPSWLWYLRDLGKQKITSNYNQNIVW